MATIPNHDPLFSEQWHLHNNNSNEFDLNVIDVWDDYTGSGVTVAVMDDGVEHDHPDLQLNYSVSQDWDFQDSDADANHSIDGFDDDGELEAHGTAVAGIIGAVEGNGVGGVGIAYHSTLLGFRGINGSNVVDAINHASGTQRTNNIDSEVDVLNMSFGMDALFHTSEITIAENNAVENAARHGRNGLGLIMVKSAGNERDENHDTNAEPLNNNRHLIAVAAVNRDGRISKYSTHGASVLVSGFGSPGEIVTTDRKGVEGYNSDQTGNYAFTFNGTSAAAPMVSGTVALMLEANPNLGWRDVQEILAYSARHVGSDIGSRTRGDEKYEWMVNGANNWNGGGLHFSNDYGFGLVDAKAAVRLAETWSTNEVPAQTSQNQTTIGSKILSSSHIVASERDGGSSFSHSIRDNLHIEHVDVKIDFAQWDAISDLKIRLTSPQKTSSILIENPGNQGSDNEESITGDWSFLSHAFRGEEAYGDWNIQLFDKDGEIIDKTIVDDISISFSGRSISEDDRFIFTEEYSEYDGGAFGHSRSINGSIGNDTINAAAVDSGTTINLSQGTGSIDGVNITLSSIENVVTGDGNDWLFGDSDDNLLRGGRGNDILRGYGGDDSLNGDKGDDLLVGGSGNDRLNGFGTVASSLPQFDRLRGGTGYDTFILGGTWGVSYFEEGDGYAVIEDWDFERDLIEVRSTNALGGGFYSLNETAISGIGSGAKDTEIYFTTAGGQRDRIAIVQDSTNVNINRDFIMV